MYSEFLIYTYIYIYIYKIYRFCYHIIILRGIGYILLTLNIWSWTEDFLFHSLCWVTHTKIPSKSILISGLSTNGFPSRTTNHVQSVSMAWRHHDNTVRDSHSTDDGRVIFAHHINVNYCDWCYAEFNYKPCPWEITNFTNNPSSTYDFWIGITGNGGLDEVRTPTSFLLSWWRHHMEALSALLAMCAGNSPVTGEYPQKGQRRGALLFSLICDWINAFVNTREAGDLRRHPAHYEWVSD